MVLYTDGSEKKNIHKYGKLREKSHVPNLNKVIY